MAPKFAKGDRVKAYATRFDKAEKDKIRQRPNQTIQRQDNDKTRQDKEETRQDKAKAKTNTNI